MSSESLGEARPFSHGDRVRQLRSFANVCSELSDAFRSAGDSLGFVFAELSRSAEALLVNGFDQPALTALSREFPDAPDWLNPKALDAGLPVEAWQREVTAPFLAAVGLALDLRTLRSY